jgi:chromosome partitioning protein
MEPSVYTPTDIKNIFRMDDRVLSKQTIFNAEKRGEIPEAQRIARGKNQVRTWEVKDLPAIGKKFGFLLQPTPGVLEIICVYTAKGGVLKSTLTHTLARIFALNGISVCVVGLDIQMSATDLILDKPVVASLESIHERVGLFELFNKKNSLDEVLVKTDLPTLQIIPENSQLKALEKQIRDVTRKEDFFKTHLIPLLKDRFQVVIFDNSPNWNSLVENSLVCASSVITPMGCDLGTYRARQANLDMIIEFEEDAHINRQSRLFAVPTLLDNSKLSKQIYGVYLSQLGEILVPHPIRRAVVGQESAVERKSVLEYDPRSGLAQDYYELAVELWNRIRR